MGPGWLRLTISATTHNGYRPLPGGGIDFVKDPSGAVGRSRALRRIASASRRLFGLLASTAFRALYVTDPNGESTGGVQLSKRNKVTRVSLIGGLIGAILTNPRKALEDEIDRRTQYGWVATHIDPHRTTNLFIWILQLVVLVLTLGLFTWGGGYLILFEREV
jgi:hypothetical protein